MAPGFTVEIVPPLPPCGPASAPAPPRDHLPLRDRLRELDNEPRQLIYRFGARMFAHYPADLVNLLGDLEREAEALRGGSDHPLRLNGVTVGEVRIAGDRLWVDGAGDRAGRPSITASVADALAAVSEAAASLRAYLESLLAAG